MGTKGSAATAYGGARRKAPYYDPPIRSRVPHFFAKQSKSLYTKAQTMFFKAHTLHTKCAHFAKVCNVTCACVLRMVLLTHRKVKVIIYEEE